MNFRFIISAVFVITPMISSALVFEKDQRTEVESSVNRSVPKLAESVFTFLPKKNLVKLANGSFEFVNSVSLKESLTLCAGEKFADSTSIGSRCSGFLITNSLGVTAGHCVSPLEIPDVCANYFVVFDYVRKNGSDPRTLHSNSVFECKSVRKIVYSQTVDTDDYAVIEFTKPVLNRKPLKYRTSGKIGDHEKLFMLGYPRGMTQKVSEDRTAIGNKNASYFSTNLDCFHGNSGSPVFNGRTNLVEGIFVRGNGFIPNQGTDPNLIGDFFRDIALGCHRTLVCRKSEGCTGVMQATRVTRISF